MTTPTPIRTSLPKVHIHSTSQVEQPKCSVLYFGPEKSGKSHLMATWPGVLGVLFEDNIATWLKFPDVPIIQPGGPTANYQERARDWEMNIRPLVEQRRLTELVRSSAEQGSLPEKFSDYTVETLAFDSYTRLGRGYFDRLSNDGTSPLGFGGWASYGSLLSKDTMVCTNATKSDPADPNLESYYFVASVHERWRFDEEGRPTKVHAQIDGFMQTELPSRFDTVLLPRIERTSNNVKRDGKVVVEYGARYWCETLPPNKWQHAGDGLGGGRFGRLPPQIEGTYPKLAKAWGLEGEKS